VFDGAKMAAPTTFDLKELALSVLGAAGLGRTS
jgi:hypothetical protein